VDLVLRAACRAGRRGPAGVARLLEKAAAEHAAALGVGIGDLRASGCAWMLSQLGIRARRWPDPGEPLEVLTWPSRRTTGARAWREFEILSGSGEPLVEAASVWLIVDLERRRPVRLPRFLLELEFPDKETAVSFSPPPEPPPEPPGTFRLSVEPPDLDINNHVNNVKWLEWAEAAANSGDASAVQIDFREEARLGEEITVFTWSRKEPPEQLQRITASGRHCAAVQWWRRQ
jgi:acyl-ACP thioesterase